MLPLDIWKLAKHVSDIAKAFNIDLLFYDEAPKELVLPVAKALGFPDGNFPYDFGAALTAKEDRERRVVLARSVTSETSYAVVMHELGHLLAPSGNLRLHMNLCRKNMNAADTALANRIKLDEEYAAWEWARANTFNWTVDMASVERACISTYEKGRIAA